MTATSEASVLQEAARLLGVPVEADADALRKAYVEAVKRAHPDRGGDAGEFIRVASAYAVLAATPIGERQVEPVRGRAGLRLSWRLCTPIAASGLAGSAALVVGVLVGPAFGLAVGITLAGALLVVTAWTAAGRLRVSVTARVVRRQSRAAEAKGEALSATAARTR